MYKNDAHQTRTTGILSVIALFCVVSIALLCGPLANGTPWTPAPFSADLDSVDGVDRHAAPDLPGRPVVVADARSAKALPGHDDGKSKGALLFAGAELGEAFFAAQCPARDSLGVVATARHGYDSRAPPCSL